MPILFSVVAYEKTVLTKYASCEGNFMEIVIQVLSKIPTTNEKITYSHGNYLLNYIVENRYIYFCITDKRCQRSRAFLFLNEIRRKFKRFGKDGFENILASEMSRYSEDYGTVTITKGDLDELNRIAVKSSETILGEKILYVKNPDNLTFSTISYVGKKPQRISVTIWNLNIYVILIVIILIGLLIYFFGPIPCCYFVVLVLAVKCMIK